MFKTMGRVSLQLSGPTLVQYRPFSWAVQRLLSTVSVFSSYLPPNPHIFSSKVKNLFKQFILFYKFLTTSKDGFLMTPYCLLKGSFT